MQRYEVPLENVLRDFNAELGKVQFSKGSLLGTGD
jgi:hypothetical protein